MKAHALKAILANTGDDDEIVVTAYGFVHTLDQRQVQWDSEGLWLTLEGTEPDEEDPFVIFPLDYRTDEPLPDEALSAARAEIGDIETVALSRAIRAAILAMVRSYNADADPT